MFKDLYMLIAFYCVCSDVHGGSSRYDGTQRSGRGDGVLLQRGRDTLILAGDTVVVHQEPRGLDGQTALDNQWSRSTRGKLSKIEIPSNGFSFKAFNSGLNDLVVQRSSNMLARTEPINFVSREQLFHFSNSRTRCLFCCVFKLILHRFPPPLLYLNTQWCNGMSAFLFTEKTQPFRV